MWFTSVHRWIPNAAHTSHIHLCYTHTHAHILWWFCGPNLFDYLLLCHVIVFTKPFSKTILIFQMIMLWALFQNKWQRISATGWRCKILFFYTGCALRSPYLYIYTYICMCVYIYIHGRDQNCFCTIYCYLLHVLLYIANKATAEMCTPKFNGNVYTYATNM